MDDYPTPMNVSRYGTLSEDIPANLKECIEECMPDMTQEQLSSCRDYFDKCCQDLRNKAAESITMSDFEKVKKDE